MSKFIDFFSLSDPNVRNVLFGSLLLTLSSSIVGCFALLKKRALVGDAVAHAVLPGVCLAFIISENKNPIIILIGAFAAGWLAILFMDFTTRHSKIKNDAAIGIALSFFFSIGILLLTHIQQSGNASQSGLDSFLFGKSASLVEIDLYVFAGTGIIIIGVILALYKELSLVAFDPAFADTIGIKVKWIEMIFTIITVLAVVVGIQAVGVVLMAAMLITPAAAARFWTHKLHVMIYLSIALSSVAVITGCFISYVAPSMPTGPWIVMTVSLIAIFSFIFSPGRGIAAQWLQQRRNKGNILIENILKMMFQISEKEKDFTASRTFDQLLEKRNISHGALRKGLRRLQSQGYIKHQNNQWALTIEGKNRGKRITRLPRLWELYLTQYLQIAPDHVHDDAETIEHILTPELELKIEQALNFPDLDPHDSEIPKR
ncbi:MAG TPA: iron chelate uptake ABC transporter family permease subunit [Cytophagaceae bacterium]